MHEKVGLSYIEVIVITVILALAAVTVVPKYTAAETESKICELIDSLEVIRRHIDLYRIHHQNNLPPAKSSENFQKILTHKSGRYTPQIREIPVNPFNKLNTIRLDGKAAGTGEAGWRYDAKTGAFQADNSIYHAVL